MFKIKDFFKLILSILVTLSAGFIGSMFTITSINSWYADLIKPELNPPNWVFGPVWTTLYVLMGIAAFLVWKKDWHKKEVKHAICIFSVQLLLNATWSIIFFGLQSPGLALINIVILWFMILWTIILFYKISKPAMYLLIPYILWVTFASYLNLSIWILN
ncbi:MAG: TspO/MBR family protein [Candidatus Paceibacterota bacterium]